MALITNMLGGRAPANRTNASGYAEAAGGGVASFGVRSSMENAEEMNAPRRFKTAFIFFSSARHKEIKEELAQQGKTEKTTNIAKMVSKEWREMTADERAYWDEKSRNDKARYEAEMASYNDARKSSKRSKKDPNAPRRPMSAFLAFSNKRRAALKREHPDATNADLSKMLSIAWKDAPADVKAEYVEEEAKLRARYKTDIVVWRKKKSEEVKAALVKKAAEENQRVGTAAAAASLPLQHAPAPSASLIASLGAAAAGGSPNMQGYGNYALLGARMATGGGGDAAGNKGLGANDFLGSLQSGLGRNSAQDSMFGSLDQLFYRGQAGGHMGQASSQFHQNQGMTSQQQIFNQALAAQQGLQLGTSFPSTLQVFVTNNPYGNSATGMQPMADSAQSGSGNWGSDLGNYALDNNSRNSANFPGSGFPHRGNDGPW